MRDHAPVILTVLVERPLTGLGIIQAAASPGGRTTLAPGSLYATLDRLAADGLVRSAGEVVEDGGVRRRYALTALGEDEARKVAAARAAATSPAPGRLAGSGA